MLETAIGQIERHMWTATSTFDTMPIQGGLVRNGGVMSVIAETSADDKKLMSLICDGDRNALRKLYERHHKRVFYFIQRFISNVATAEDLANDVFIEVWQSAEKYEGRSQVSSWLLGIARFKALSERRKIKPTVDPDEALGGLADDKDSPETTAQKMNKGEILKACVQKLSEEHRVVVDLIYYHSKSMNDVGEILDLPLNTVKTRAFHARKKLSILVREAGLDRGWP